MLGRLIIFGTTILFSAGCRTEVTALKHVDEVQDLAETPETPETPTEPPPSETRTIEYFVRNLNPAKVYDGNILFVDTTGFSAQRLVEIDRNGGMVWSYTVPPELVSGSVVLDVERAENGDTMFSVDGGGVHIVDKDGVLIFSKSVTNVSHDGDMLENRNLLLVNGWAAVGANHVTELSREHDEPIWAYDAAAYNVPEHRDVFDEGWLHVSGAQRQADGSTLMSLRNLNRVIMVNAAGETLWEVVSEGTMADHPDGAKILGDHPHDPAMVDENHVIFPLHHPDVIYEVNIHSKEVVWSYRPGRDIPGAKGARDADRLPNGNTFIALNNHLVEVTPEKEVVWTLYSRSIYDPDGSEAEIEGAEDVPANELMKTFYKAQIIGADGTLVGG